MAAYRRVNSAGYYRYLSYFNMYSEIVVPVQSHQGSKYSGYLKGGWDLSGLGEMSNIGQHTSDKINLRLSKRFKF